MTTTNATRTEVTTRYAIDRLIQGLREFAAATPPPAPTANSSRANRARYFAAIATQQRALEIADQLQTATDDDEAKNIIRVWDNTMVNMDPHGFYLGRWKHVAILAGGERRYILDGGVLCICDRPRGYDWRWDSAACQWERTKEAAG